MTERGEKRYALLGRRLGHSLSPRIHGLFFLHTALEGRYTLLEAEPEAVEPFVRGLPGSGLAGINVTIPYKQAVMPALDRLSPEARDIGAVNTVALEDGGLTGYNTDYFGFMGTLRRAGIPVAGRKAVILGTGGAARAVFCALRDGGASSVTLVSRNPRQAAERFDGAEVTDYAALGSGHGYELLVNCTPVGMYPHPEGCPLTEAQVRGFESAVDLIYNPVETRLLALARAGGARCANGLYMLIAQAVRAQAIWNGMAPDNGVIDRIFDRMQNPPRQNIVLIGMPGSGKTTVGRALALASGRRFVDLDDCIEAGGESVAALFSRGEDVFRERETRAARQAAATEGAVVATGGGVVTRAENIRALSRTGRIFYLDRPVEAILKDIDYGVRPLLTGGAEALRELYERRADLYRQYADDIVENSGGPEAAAAHILAAMKGAVNP